MKILDYQAIKQEAGNDLSLAPVSKKLILIYSLSTIAISLAVTVLQYILNLQISHSGGLSNLGLRSLLSSVTQFLPIIQTGVLLILEFGYMASMVRISRRQYTSVHTLRVGLDRFWPLVRSTILKMLIYAGTIFVSFYAAIALFLISPFSDRVTALVSPLIEESNVLTAESLVLDETIAQAVFRSCIPAFIMLGIVVLLLLPPVFYRFRMVNYVLYDNPGKGAMYALRQSKLMMRGNRLSLFRLDLHFWWYYLIQILIGVIAYGDVLLPMIGVKLPIADEIGFFLFYFISLVFQFLSLYYFRNQLETAYAIAYDSIRPAPKNDGVVLGNIFQM